MAKRKNQTKSAEVSGKQAQRVGLFGASGCGKTTKARSLTAGLNRIIYFDPLAELTSAAGVSVFYDLEKLKKALKTNFIKGFKFDFVPTFGREIKQLNDLCYYLLELQTGYKNGIHAAQITLFVDELDIAFPSGITQKEPQNGFSYLCRRGRHYGINLIGISQRPHQVDICFRGNCSGVYWFRHAEPSDIDTATRAIGKEYRQTIRNLCNYQYIYKAGGQIYTHL